MTAHAMIYRKLGRSDLRVSAICLGTMMFGDRTDAAEASSILASAVDHGVNFIDTADVYKYGASESMLGELMRGHRSKWILATKVGNKMSEALNEGHYSRSWIMRAVDASLSRLQTDWIDIYYLHRDFIGLDLEEPVRAMGDLVRMGKIRAWGVSNFRGWRIAEMVRLADAMGMARPAVCQPYYNLLNRMPEVEILPACAHYGIGVATYSPAARGVLTGKYPPGQKPPQESRAGRHDRRMMETEFREESLRIAQTLKERAGELGVSLLQYAIAWLLANRTVSSVIAGPRTLEQWNDYFGALALALTVEDERLVDSLVAPGHPSTPGYNDPSHPVFGRAL